MPKAQDEMLVINKVYDLVIWSSNHIAKFPRSHRFTLGDRLEMRLYEVLEMLLRAKYSRERVAMLRDVNMELELLRFQFRLAKDLKCLALESYGYASRAVNEIGKLLGGWIKQSLSAPRASKSEGGADHETTRRTVAAAHQLPEPRAGGSQGVPKKA